MTAWPILGKTALWALALLGGVVLLAALACGAVVLARRKRIPRRVILTIDLDRGLVEHVPKEPAARLMGGRNLVVRDVVEGLDRASRDDRVAGLLARVGAGSSGLAQIQEVRDAVLAFRESRKPAAAFAETFGEAGPGNGAYYLACAFDTIYLQPSGDVGLTGLFARSPFFRGTLEKLGVLPRVDHRKEYKNMKNLFTEGEFTAPHREATATIVASWLGQIVKGVARGRGLSEDDVRALVDRGPFLGKEAVDAGLVDGLLYRDQVREKIREKTGGDVVFLPFPTYVARTAGFAGKRADVALIYGVGNIRRGRSRYSPIGGSAMGADTIASAFRSAVNDRKVRAILFRVDSRGGSYVASDTIWRETIRAREAGKPVIVSMGNTAGSGGYFVAMAANRIVAHPATLTGSIGVVTGKPVDAGFWQKAGVTWDEVHEGRNAALWSWIRDYTPGEWQRIQDALDRIYDDFTEKVARGRNLPKEKVLEIARGRVWTGEDAKAHGLVDELGGYPAALRLLREAAGIPPDAPVRLRLFPARKSAWQLLLERRGDGGGEETEALASGILSALGPVLRLFGRAAREIDAGVLSMRDIDAGRDREE